MNKKKRFGVSQALQRGLSETINVVENNPQKYRAVVVTITRIELDPDNPIKKTGGIKHISSNNTKLNNF